MCGVRKNRVKIQLLKVLTSPEKSSSWGYEVLVHCRQYTIINIYFSFLHNLMCNYRSTPDPISHLSRPNSHGMPSEQRKNV